MFSSKSLLSMLAVGGLFIGSQANATVVAQDDTMLNGGPNLGATEWFEFGGPFVAPGKAQSDLNEFAIFTGNGFDNGGLGFSHHVDVADVTAVTPIANGITMRTSAWVLSDPNNPWIAGGLPADGWKIEFYNVALDAFENRTIDTENAALEGALVGGEAGTSTTTGWTQISYTFEFTDVSLLDGGGLFPIAEVRPVLFEGGFPAAEPVTGNLFVDGFVFEVFPDLATANATPLPTNTPGGFDVPDLSGDINQDGFVGIADLNIVLGTWNNGFPPAPSAAPSIPEPASLALLGLGGLALVRRR